METSQIILIAVVLLLLLVNVVLNIVVVSKIKKSEGYAVVGTATFPQQLIPSYQTSFNVNTDSDTLAFYFSDGNRLVISKTYIPSLQEERQFVSYTKSNGDNLLFNLINLSTLPGKTTFKFRYFYNNTDQCQTLEMTANGNVLFSYNILNYVPPLSLYLTDIKCKTGKTLTVRILSPTTTPIAGLITEDVLKNGTQDAPVYY